MTTNKKEIQAVDRIELPFSVSNFDHDLPKDDKVLPSSSSFYSHAPDKEIFHGSNLSANLLKLNVHVGDAEYIHRIVY